MIHKTTRSILSVLLAALLLVTSTPLTPAFAGGGGAVSPQSESGESEGLTGDGTREDPYQIGSAEQLAKFRDKVNSGETSAWAELTADIDLSEICSEEKGDSWTPIGSDSSRYKGTFDGNNYTISGLYIDSSDNDYQGLFGYVSGTVKDLTVSGNVSADWYVGGVVGVNSGNVEDCDFTGSVSGSGNSVGGVVGDNSGTVENCYNTGEVSGNNYVGGVVGYNDGASVTNCYNTGKVSGPDSVSVSYVGGVVGYNSGIGNVKNCYNTGTVTGTDDYVGGVVGHNDVGGSVTNSYNTGEVSGNSYVGGVVGYNGGSVTGCYFLQDTAEKGIGENYGSGDATPLSAEAFESQKSFANWTNFTNTWEIKSIFGRPTLKANAEIGGTANNPYKIFTATQLETFRDIVNDENGQVKDSDAHAKLMNDIDLEGNATNQWTPIGSDYVGGIVGWNSGSVTNCYNIGDVSGQISAGGVVGQNSSTVENCYNIGKVRGNIYVGGVVGQNINGSITNCYYQKDKGAIVGIGDTTKDNSSQTEVKSLKDFQSGEVAYLLQGTQTTPVWGQSNLIEEDSWPTLIALDKNAKTVYKVTVDYNYDGAQNKTTYTNDTATPSEQPSRDGYTFDHWDKTEGEGNTITYTAQWTPHTYSITASPSTLNFGSITEGEERPAAQTVTVKNTGNQTVTLNPPTATNFEITTSDELTLNAGESVEFTIQPKDKLPRGSYSEQIAISGNDGASATLTATFTVKEPPYTGKYSYEVSTSVGDHGSLTVDRYATEGDKVTITVTPDEAYKLDDLTVTAHGKEVALTANSDGTYTFTMPSADVRITATFAEDPDWTEPEEPATDVSDIFLDVAPNAWYKDAVQYAYDQGLMTGVSATEFAPEATTTRAMIVSILARLEGVTTAQAAGFADVNDNDWYATAVNWAANVGVVNGYEDNTFQPNTAITREQLAAILMNYAAYKGEDVSNRADLTSYTDQPSTWAQEAMSWAVAEGLISGVTNDQLQPQGNATRAQVAAILQRFLEA